MRHAILVFTVLCCLILTAFPAAAAAPAAGSGHQQLLAFFPMETGVTWRYRGQDGENHRITLAGTESRPAGTNPNYIFAGSGRGKTYYIDMNRLTFTAEPDGQYEVADVWLKCYVDEQARSEMIRARAGMEEPVKGFMRLAYYTQHVWLKIPVPALRDQDREPVRMISQEVYYDPYGRIIYATEPRKHWQGGKWFTIAGFEAVMDTVSKLRDDVDIII